jgi:C4-dicarboxylate-specific signal transduction histidine kinase
MVQGQDHVTAINPHLALQTILPILKAEASQRKITLTYSNQVDDTRQTMSNKVMLQRIVFNTVGHSLDALESKATIQPEIKITVFTKIKDERNWLVVQIEDNGPGFSDELLAQLDCPHSDHQTPGHGFGLVADPKHDPHVGWAHLHWQPAIHQQPRRHGSALAQAYRNLKKTFKI